VVLHLDLKCLPHPRHAHQTVSYAIHEVPYSSSHWPVSTGSLNLAFLLVHNLYCTLIQHTERLESIRVVFNVRER
jgi:hypothetical protein